MTDSLPRIDLLFSPRCGVTKSTSIMVRDVLSELGLEAGVSEVVVNTHQKAMDLRFLGSPSIRVNGSDIEPGAEEQQNYGLQ
ncbi:MAG: hypothetical protein HWN68_07245 [Desulfobacterales bacterium]|nr:hypothetical protein [Desulfobacterales bacterium]